MRAISSASVTSGCAIRSRGSCDAAGPAGGWRWRSRTRAVPPERGLTILEPPENDVTDSDEEQHETERVRRAVVQHRIEREPEPESADEHAFAQVGPGRAALDLLRLLVQRCRRRDCGDRRRGAAGQRTERLCRWHDPLFREPQ